MAQFEKPGSLPSADWREAAWQGCCSGGHWTISSPSTSVDKCSNETGDLHKRLSISASGEADLPMISLRLNLHALLSLTVPLDTDTSHRLHVFEACLVGGLNVGQGLANEKCGRWGSGRMSRLRVRTGQKGKGEPGRKRVSSARIGVTARRIHCAVQQCGCESHSDIMLGHQEYRGTIQHSGLSSLSWGVIEVSLL